MPKPLRDDMRRQLGVDDYRGTPEQFNSDAVIPVYCCGKYTEPKEVIFEEAKFALVAWAGVAELNVGLWTPSAYAGMAGYLHTNFPGRTDIQAKLDILRYRVDITSAGRATLNTAKARLLVELMYSQTIVEEETEMVVREWIHYCTAESGEKAKFQSGHWEANSGSTNDPTADRPRYGEGWCGEGGWTLPKWSNCKAWYLRFRLEECDTLNPVNAPAGTLITVYDHAECSTR